MKNVVESIFCKKGKTYFLSGLNSESKNLTITIIFPVSYKC